MINKIRDTRGALKEWKSLPRIQVRVAKDYAVHLGRYHSEKGRSRNYHVSLYAFLNQILNNPVEPTVMISPLGPDQFGQELVWIDVSGYAKYDIPKECFIFPGGEREVLHNFE